MNKLATSKRYSDLTFVRQKRKTYCIWNGARYSEQNRIEEGYGPRDVKRGSTRWKCTAQDCNASIYEIDGNLVMMKRHDQGMPHNTCYHRNWNDAAICRQNAIDGMRSKVRLGATPDDAYWDWCLENDEAAENVIKEETKDHCAEIAFVLPQSVWINMAR